MSTQDETNKELHESICVELNVDPEAAQQSWESYQSICQNYTLDGEPLHWICCALYVACRKSVTPTVGTSGGAVEGNCVSLTKLLRLCNISLIQFFIKIKRWIEMASMPDDFKNRLEKLEKNFAVSTFLFKKFKMIFSKLFIRVDDNPTPRSVNGRGSKKHKLLPCNCTSVFEFCWCLFICIKGEFPHLSHDLVNMHHVLLSCIDMIYGNSIVAVRRDLVNPVFEGLPKDWSHDSFTVSSEPPCILSQICDKELLLEAKSLKEYVWKPVISKFFEQGILKGIDKNFTGLLDVVNFDTNLRSLNNLYETYVLSVGEFDERIFLGDSANEIGNSGKGSSDELSKTIANFTTGGRSLAPDTPLTGRRYLKSKGEEPLTPVSAATQCVAKLHAFVGGWKAEPSIALLDLLKKCGSSETMLTEWVTSWAKTLEAGLEAEGYVAAEWRMELIQRFYYCLLLAVLRRETQRKPNFSLQFLLGSETFQHTLFACSAEVVLHAYGSQSACFPWVLKTLNLPPFHFYKIIEIIVYEIKEKLSRDTVKHLNAIEEKVLESLVWTSDSPIWEQIEQVGGQIPKECEVCPPSQDGQGVDPKCTPPAPPAPSQSVSSHKRSTIVTAVAQSPVSSATDRFLLPVTDMARKQLFRDSSIKPGQSLLTQNAVNNVQSPRDGVIVQGGSNAAQGHQGHNKENTPKKTVKAGSLGLFFRKFYRLAVVRMQDLCTRLGLDDTELKRKIWTCLEHSVTHQTQLLRDRHLDQVLMCAVYVICKVSNNTQNSVERTFTDIMKCYRQQPRADNNVYRQVLIKPMKDGVPDSPEARGDLIKFYNTVYVQCMQSFALRFTGRQAEECPLSPLPSPRTVAANLGAGNPLSPGGQRVSQHHQLYVRPLTRSTPGTPPHSSANHLTYCFSRSPAKDLRAINSMLSCEISVGGIKRTSPHMPDSDTMKRLCLASGVKRKVHGLITDRQTV